MSSVIDASAITQEIKGEAPAIKIPEMTFEQISEKYVTQEVPYSVFYCVFQSHIPRNDVREIIFNALEVKPTRIEFFNAPYNSSINPENLDKVPCGAIIMEFNPPTSYEVWENGILRAFGSKILMYTFNDGAYQLLVDLAAYKCSVLNTNIGTHFAIIVEKLGFGNYKDSFTGHDDRKDGIYNAQAFLCMYNKIIDKKYLGEALKYGQEIAKNGLTISHLAGWTIAFIKYTKKVSWKHKQNRFRFVVDEEYYVFTMKPHHQRPIQTAVHEIDPTNGKGSFFTSSGEMVQFCKSEQEVAFMSDPKSLMPNLRAFQIMKESEETPAMKYFKEYKLWGWQKYVFEKYLCNYPDPRKIIWIHSAKPGVGKTTIATALMVQRPDYFYSIADPTNAYHVATIKTMALNKWNNHCLFVNLSMRYRDYENLYPLLENLKDYFVTSSKYQGQTRICGYGHVIVLSNFPPYPYDSTGQELIALDRLEIIEAITSPEEKDPNPSPPSGTIKSLVELQTPKLPGQDKTAQLIQDSAQTGFNIKPRENPLDEVEGRMRGKYGKIKGK